MGHLLSALLWPILFASVAVVLLVALLVGWVKDWLE